MKHVAVVLVLAVILIPAFYLAAEQNSEPEPGTLQDEMRALNVTMKEIAALLEKHVESQHTDLLIQRVDLTDRNLSARRDELRKARAEADTVAEEAKMLSLNLRGWQESMDRGEVPEEDRETLLHQAEQIETRLESLENRRRDLSRRVVELENAIFAYEEDMEILEAVLDEKLGLR